MYSGKAKYDLGQFAQTSVTRFGEILVLGRIIEGLFSVWQNVELTLVKSYLSNFKCFVTFNGKDFIYR